MCGLLKAVRSSKKKKFPRAAQLTKHSNPNPAAQRSVMESLSLYHVSADLGNLHNNTGYSKRKYLYHVFIQYVLLPYPFLLQALKQQVGNLSHSMLRRLLASHQVNDIAQDTRVNIPRSIRGISVALGQRVTQSQRRIAAVSSAGIIPKVNRNDTPESPNTSDLFRVARQALDQVQRPR